MFREFVHYGIHFIGPILIGLLFFKSQKLKVILILLAGILIDIDHLWANPIFDPNRCSIAFHPLHTYWAIILYIALVIPKKTRLIGLAFSLHIFADAVDCLFLRF